MKHYLQFNDLNADEYAYLFARAGIIKTRFKNYEKYTPLVDRTLAMIFEKASTRTRVSFEAGMYQMGGSVVNLTTGDSQLGRAEPINDSAKVISRMVDLVMIRTFEQTKIEQFSADSRVPVINGLTNEFHPCQILADIFTFIEHRGSIKGKVVAWVGDGNNMATTWLQAADILVHRATHVPVGHDQAQHLEFARKCARTFNHRYGTIFHLPETILSPAKRVMSLTQPKLKMSKSHQDPRSRILISDSQEAIAQKVKTAVTDSVTGVSYDPVKRPGVSNLIEIMHHFRADGTSCADIARDCENLAMRAFKEEVAKCINDHLSEIRQQYEALMSKENEGYLREVAELGVTRACASAAETMHLVRDAVGLGGFQSFAKNLD